MDLFELLQRGYFPKELPPAFNTYKFALKGNDFLSTINTQKAYNKKASAPAHYSIEKSNVSRRVIHIPNPFNYLKLAEIIVKNEVVLFHNIPHSPFSVSEVYYESNISERCIKPQHHLLRSLQREKLKMSLSKRYEIKLDVANFYSSIYTHSISWALLGRDRAKTIWSTTTPKSREHSTDADVILYNIADEIDVALRNCNECQTHGILTGPDISFMIGELIMSRIDTKLARKYPNLEGHRYYDDYTLYVNTSEEADEIYQSLQEELRQFGMEINEAKYIKKKSPTAIKEDYVREINPVRITQDNATKNDGLIRLFDILWRCAELQPDKSQTIFKYGLNLLINQQIKIDNKNKGIYEPLLYKTVILKPSLLPLLCKILDFSQQQPSIDLLSNTIATILKERVPYAQDNEVAWALWMCKKYHIIIDTSMICKILKMGSSVCTIILLDILHSERSIILGDASVQQCINDISVSWNANSLYSEDWLLLYEASEYGWINKNTLISADPFFSMLHNEGVHFYDSNINADYTSFDYIETLPYDYYPLSTREEAKSLKNTLIDKIREDALDKYYDDTSIEDEDAKEEILASINESIEDSNIDEKILNQILNPIFRGERIDEEEIVHEFLKRINIYSEY